MNAAAAEAIADPRIAAAPGELEAELERWDETTLEAEIDESELDAVRRGRTIDWAMRT